MVKKKCKKPYKCSLCSQAYTLNIYLDWHLQLKHSDDGLICSYPECAVTSSSILEHRKHMRTHPITSTYHCRQCNQNLVRKDRIQAHKKHHQEELNVPCEYCDKRFPTRGRANKHMRAVHLFSDKFKCELCTDKPRYFRTKNSLKNHQNTFHKLGTIKKCPYCPATYWHRSSFKRHVNKVHRKSG